MRKPLLPVTYLFALLLIASTLTAYSAFAVLNGQVSLKYPAVVKIDTLGRVIESRGVTRPDEFLCTGTFVSDRLILTAAHCLCPLVANKRDPKFSSFFPIPENNAAYSLKINDIEMAAAEIGFAPNAFGNHCRERLVLPASRDNDFAFIRLSKIERRKLPMGMLEIDSSPVKSGDAVEVLGYGNTQVKFLTKTPQSDDDVEYNLYGTKFLGLNQVHSIDREGIRVMARFNDASVTTVLPGDSGGPLVRNGKLIGVASRQHWLNFEFGEKKYINDTYYVPAADAFFQDTVKNAISKTDALKAE